MSSDDHTENKYPQEELFATSFLASLHKQNEFPSPTSFVLSLRDVCRRFDTGFGQLRTRKTSPMKIPHLVIDVDAETTDWDPAHGFMQADTYGTHGEREMVEILTHSSAKHMVSRASASPSTAIPI